MYFDEPRHLAWAPYGYPISETMPLPKPEYFSRLLEQFPNSPLLGFAQWRLAECDFRPAIYHDSKQLGQLDDESRDRLIEQFGKVTGEPGSLPWAWTQSRLGRLSFQAGDCDKAVERYRSITETMPPGVEEINALLNLAKCPSCTNQSEAARVAIEAGKSLPNIEQRDKSFGHYESLLGYGESQELASRLK